MSVQERQPIPVEEYMQPVDGLAKSFIQRWDIHARQLEDGRYVCIHSPLKTKHLISHLQGDITLGTYLLDRVSQSRFIVFDADDDLSFSHLNEVACQLEYAAKIEDLILAARYINKIESEFVKFKAALNERHLV